MRIAITGHGGMLAQALAETFQDVDELLLWSRDDLDITDAKAVETKLEETKPDVVINAAAYTAVDKAEEEETLATRINGDGVRNLAEAAKAIGAKLVHYSTDYVFRGDRAEGYDESFEGYDPVNAYGRSKLAGEQALKEVGGDCYLVRTAWLYGPGGPNFVDTMLSLAEKMPELKVVSDQHGKPTYTVDLAAATKEILEGGYVPGIYHVTNETSEGGITWYDFAVEIFKQTGKEISVQPCTSEEFPRPALRPEYSVLLNTKLPPRHDWK